MFQRIMIFGKSGSGKSTFSTKLHQATRIPLYHLDRYFFIENWVERNYDEFLSIQQNFVDHDEWIIDGNSFRSLEMRYARATICIYFNYSRFLCLWRILKRIFLDRGDLQDRAQGCKDRFSWKLIKYMWGFEQRVEKTIRELREKYPSVLFMEVKNDRDLDRVIEKVTNEATIN